jgi:peptidylprolyl isomerase
MKRTATTLAVSTLALILGAALPVAAADASATTAPETKAAATPAPAAASPATAAPAASPAAAPAAPANPELAAPPDVAAAPADAQKTASGLASKVLKPGTGTEHPSATSMVKIHYTGWTPDGKMFDSSVQRKKPAMFPVNAVIPGFSEGLQLMTVGEKRRLWIPGPLAYDNSDRPGAPKGMLVFDVEMLQIVEPPVTPTDVAAAPADAQKTASGIASKVLQPGTGTTHPKKGSTVQVHYSGWTTDGKMFDSSVMRGTPTEFRLDQVIPGWTEGVQLMVEGEKRRFWIPGNLAYDNSPRPGVPKGMLVFDIELLKITQP